MQRLIYMSLAHYYRKRLCQLCILVNLWFRMCTSLAPRPKTVVFGLGTRLCVRMRANFEMASYATNSSQRVLWIAFVDQGEFEAMKIVCGHTAPYCAKHHFAAKNTVRIWAVFEISQLRDWRLNWGVRHKRNLVHCRQKSNWNPELHNEIRNPLRNAWIHSEIQKSTLKSVNPIWNPEIQSKNDLGFY